MGVPIAEPWDSIMSRVGARPLRRGRGACPLCESRTGFSAHDVKGFHCFACGAKGDKIGFIQQLYKCDFKSAMRWFGLKPGKPPAPNPEALLLRNLRKKLKIWVHDNGHKLRKIYYIQGMVIAAMRKRLRRNPEDEEAWELLAEALRGHDVLEHKLDALIGTVADQIELLNFMERQSK